MYPNYYIKRDTINIEKSKPILKSSITSPYVCADSDNDKGYIIFTGEGIKLNCITLGQTSYLWEKKNASGGYDFVSNEQNPRISPITEANSGTYRVTVTPEYCGTPITGEV